MSKIDIVYGMCVHGNNMASCQECKRNLFPDDSDLLNMQKDIDPEIQDALNKFSKKAGKKKPKKNRFK